MKRSGLGLSGTILTSPVKEMETEREREKEEGTQKQYTAPIILYKRQGNESMRKGERMESAEERK